VYRGRSQSSASRSAHLLHPLPSRGRWYERDISPVQFLLEGLLPPGESFKSYQAALSHVAYHFRCPEKAGCVELIDSQQRRGATEHIYRGKAKVFFTDEEFARLPISQRRTLSRTTFQGLIARVDSAMDHETFDKREDRHLTWTPATLDQLRKAVDARRRASE
jgi:hypothetical protein